MSIAIKNRTMSLLIAADDYLPLLSHAQKTFLNDWLAKYEALGGQLPSRLDFHPATYGRLMMDVVIFDILKNPLDFQYRLFGSNVRHNTYDDYTGMVLSKLSGKGPDSQIWQSLSHVTKRERPIYDQVPYVGPYEDFKTLTALYLPLTGNDQTFSKILVVTHFSRKKLQAIPNP